MGCVIRPLLFIAVGAAATVSAQSAGGPAASAPTPACALLSVSEVREITGRREYPDYVDGDPDEAGAGGGSSCQYWGATFNPGDHAPLLSFVLIRGRNWTERSRNFPLAGTNDLIMQLDVEPPATEASVRQTLVAIARVVVRKLR